MDYRRFPIFFLPVPRYVKDGDIGLRPLRIFDGRLVNSGLRDDDILRSGGLAKPLSGSWISLWWWLKKTYVLSYCIEIRSEPIGFIGLYNMSPDRSAEISLAIFDKRNRRLGYGTRAFNLLAQNIKRYPGEIRVRIRTDNHAAVSFWSKLGFKELSDLGDMKLMSMDLSGGKH
jgi:RimJ/RimL family protein N-acetyltransferase